MEIQHEDKKDRGRFHTSDGLGEIVYRWSGDKEVVIEHTEVDSSLQGQGVGKKLVEAVLSWAQSKDLSVTPICTYAAAVINRMKK